MEHNNNPPVETDEGRRKLDRLTHGLRGEALLRKLGLTTGKDLTKTIDAFRDSLKDAGRTQQEEA